MSEDTIRELLRSTENTLSERFRVIEDLLRLGGRAAGGAIPNAPSLNISQVEFDSLKSFQDGMTGITIPNFIVKFGQIDARLDRIEQRLERLLTSMTDGLPLPGLIPAHPLEGLEVIPKREVVVEAPTPAVAAATDAISKEDRLLLNRTALKALEAEEMGEGGVVDHPEMVEEGVADSEDEAEAEEGGDVEMEDAEAEEPADEAEAEEVVEEADEEMADAEAEEVELEEFEYRGATYYRDGEGNVFMTDEAGELVEEPIGVWNEAKQRIVVKKASA